MAAVDLNAYSSAVGLLERPWPAGRRPLDIPTPTPDSDSDSDSGSGSGSELRSGLRPAAAVPWIATKLCPGGHPNNPDRLTCAVCRASFPAAAKVVDMAPRPVARLLLEDGTAIDVAGRLMVGRSPGRSTAARADTLTVGGRQVSRFHLILDVQGWQLTIQDADSTNGTFLARRGERGRRRIPADRAVPVEIGMAIHFGSRQVLVSHVG